MLFVMGWSSVVFASVKSMQMDVNHQNMAKVMETETHHTGSKHQMMHHAVSSNEEAPCHDMKIDHCKMTLVHDSSSHNQCKDCSILHCQTFFSSLDSSLSSAVTQPTLTDFSTVLNFNYSAQYSKGYWQDLLRPPQA